MKNPYNFFEIVTTLDNIMKTFGIHT